MRIVHSALLSLLLAAPLAAQRVDVAVTELPTATLDELARVPVATPPGEHRQRPRPRVAGKAAIGDAIVATLVPVAESVPPPRVVKSFQADFDPLPLATTDLDPADASGAAGPRHVVGAFNNALTVHDRNGTRLSLVTMQQFWHDPTIPDTFMYDPRVLYDAVNDRWVLAMLTDNNVRSGVVLLAVTASGDPAGSWRRFRIGISGDPRFAGDFTRMAMTSDQIVITANEYDGDTPTGVDVFTILKSTAYTDFVQPTVTLTRSTTRTDLTPVASADTTVRMLTPNGGSTLSLYQLAGSAFVLVQNYSPSASFGAGGKWCQQLGTTELVDCGEGLVHYALLRDGVLWIAQTATDSGVQSAAAIWRISGSSAKAYVLSDPNFDYAFPSIAVNRYGAALVGYSIMDKSIYPSAGYRYIDPAGNVSASATIKDGESYFSLFRWGDYSTTVVDPLDDTSFWTIQTYATPPRGTVHDTWGTWWAYVRPPQRVRAVKH